MRMSRRLDAADLRQHQLWASAISLNEHETFGERQELA
jgi:hypothetical protein